MLMLWSHLSFLLIICQHQTCSGWRFPKAQNGNPELFVLIPFALASASNIWTGLIIVLFPQYYPYPESLEVKGFCQFDFTYLSEKRLLRESCQGNTNSFCNTYITINVRKNIKFEWIK